jgi:hypothetical protein
MKFIPCGQALGSPACHSGVPCGPAERRTGATPGSARQRRWQRAAGQPVAAGGVPAGGSCRHLAAGVGSDAGVDVAQQQRLWAHIGRASCEGGGGVAVRGCPGRHSPTSRRQHTRSVRMTRHPVCNPQSSCFDSNALHGGWSAIALHKPVSLPVSSPLCFPPPFPRSARSTSASGG